MVGVSWRQGDAAWVAASGRAAGVSGDRAAGAKNGRSRRPRRSPEPGLRFNWWLSGRWRLGGRFWGSGGRKRRSGGGGEALSIAAAEAFAGARFAIYLVAVVAM